MKPVKTACVHPAALQLFQKLVESMMGSCSERGSIGVEGEDWRDTQISSSGAEDMAELVHGGERETLLGLEWYGEGGSPSELCCGTGGPAVC